MLDNCMDGMVGASADKALLLTLYGLDERQGSLHALLLPCSHAGDTSQCSHVSSVCADFEHQPHSMQGAIVANYPWDGSTNPNTSYSASPDDAAFRHLASVYANAHLDMHKSQEFPGGITNGAHWYPLSGGMQVRTC